MSFYFLGVVVSYCRKQLGCVRKQPVKLADLVRSKSLGAGHVYLYNGLVHSGCFSDYTLKHYAVKNFRGDALAYEAELVAMRQLANGCPKAMQEHFFRVVNVDTEPTQFGSGSCPLYHIIYDIHV